MKRTLTLPILSASHPDSRLVSIPPKLHAVNMKLISRSLAFSPSGSLRKRRKI